MRVEADGDRADAVAIDDVLVARPERGRVPRAWADLTADAVRGPDGDETFGSLTVVGPRGVTLHVRGKAVAFGWPDVDEFTFRRAAVAEWATSGEHVHVRLRSVDGTRDVLAGAVTAFHDRKLVLAHAVFGELTIPRERLEEVRFDFRGRRLPVDATPRHLGNRPAFGFAVPKPEGLRFAKTVTLDPVPADGFVVIDAAQVNGSGTPVEVRVNGERVGELNRFADRPDAVVRRYRLPVPARLWRKETDIEVRLAPEVGARVTGVDLRAVRFELPN
jgi:hypothetical protein